MKQPHDKMRLTEAAKAKPLSVEEILLAGKSGKIPSPRAKLTREVLEAHIKELYELSEAQRLSEEDIARLSSDTQVVQMHIKERGLEFIYVTLMIDGQILLPTSESELVDLEREERHGIEPLVHYVGDAHVFDPIATPQRKAAPQKKGPTKTPPKQKPIIVRHPVVDQYFQQKSKGLAFALENSTHHRGRVISAVSDLERVITNQEFLQRAVHGGWTFEVEPVTSYVCGLKRRIRAYQKERYRELFEGTPVLRDVVFDYYGSLLARAGVREPDKKDRSAHAFAVCRHDVVLGQEEDNILTLYKDIMDRKGKASKSGEPESARFEGQHYIIVLREFLRENTNEARQILSSAQKEKIFHEFVKKYEQDSDFVRDFEGSDVDTKWDMMVEKVTEATRKWVTNALAADEVRKSDYIQREIIPLLRRDCSPDTVVNNNFNAFAKLAKLVVGPEKRYDPNQLRMYIRGLWVEGLMEKNVEGRLEPRTAEGLMSEYTNGLQNLLVKYKIYDGALKSAFQQMLDRGDFDREGLHLETQARCTSFGFDIYKEALPADKERFTRLHQPDVPLKAGGLYMSRILRMYVAVNREWFLERVKDRQTHYEQKPKK